MRQSREPQKAPRGRSDRRLCNSLAGFRGKAMPGRMGAQRTTVLNLEVVKVLSEEGLLLLRGAVPGPKGGLVLVRKAVKASG